MSSYSSGTVTLGHFVRVDFPSFIVIRLFYPGDDARLERVKAAVANKELTPPEPGAMSYMLSKEGHLNDQDGHWVPHLMFHIPKTDGATWGANLDGSPVLLDPREVPEPETVFYVPVSKWSDGTPAPVM